MTRCFIGFLLPEEVKKEVARMQDEITGWPLVCKMVERENLHINFSFLGEISDEQIGEIVGKIDEISSEFKKFDVGIDGLKAIPSGSYIRVLAFDVFESTGILKSLFERIAGYIGGDTKPPHITLCRVKAVKNKNEIRKKLEEEGNKTHGRFALTSIQLIKSELSRSGPTYSIVHDAELS